MPFTSFKFWLIFPFIFLLYWLIPSKWNQWRKIFLVVVSYLLYMNWKPAFAIVLIAVTIITFWSGLFLESQPSTKKKKRIIWFLSLLGMLPLLVFKYYNFLNSSLSAGLSAIGLQFALPGLNWAVPIGISFYTFQAVGYMLDVYYERVNAEKSFLDYTLFVSFFPQVTSGPICTAEELMPQIKAIHSFDYEQVKRGLKQLLWGMFIKLVIADRLGLFVDNVYENYIHYNGSTIFVASVFYSLQIYCDFAGYSLMAIGLARTLGFNLIDNFRRPYLALSVTDFWKRWHISLTRWLTRQVYIPLGGSRCSKVKTYRNIIITFLVSGIWHGANWTFIFWGVIHGTLQMIEKAFGWQRYEGNNWVVRTVRITCTFLLVNFAWVFFRMPNIGDAFAVIGRMFTGIGAPDLSFLGGAVTLMLTLGLSILIFKDLRDEYFKDIFRILESKPVRWLIYVVLFCMVLNFGVLDGGDFIYVSF